MKSEEIILNFKNIKVVDTIWLDRFVKTQGPVFLIETFLKKTKDGIKNTIDKKFLGHLLKYLTFL